MSDEVNDLIELKNGSEKAFETIYKRYAGKLYNFIMTISHGNRYMAEEIAQSVFVKLWEIHQQINPEKSILSFLSVIAKNNHGKKGLKTSLAHCFKGKNCSRDGDIKRINLTAHGDFDSLCRIFQPELGEPVCLGAHYNS